MEIGGWLADHGLDEYAPAFEAGRILVADLPLLTNDDLRELGLPIGPRRRLLHLVRSEFGESETDGGAAETASRRAERRQMTVCFADLVGSTELSSRLDPEELRGVMVRYQDLVTTIVERHGGHVAKYLGDGTLAYFGWPVASEDGASRAVAAALEIVVRVATLDVDASDRERLASRVGIASGPVVIGDIAGERNAVVGRTPNLAARLEGVAGPGEVAIDDVTAQLVGGDFALSAPSATELKGIPGTVDVSTVITATPRRGRFGSRYRDPTLTPFAGREAEMAQLRDAWLTACGGSGQLVLISGEAGIGKSRLVDELMSSWGDEPRRELRLQCSPIHSSSVLYPALQVIAAEAGVGRAVDSVDQRMRLAAYVASWAEEAGETAEMLAELMHLGPPPARGEVSTGGAEELRNALQMTLVRWLGARLDGRGSLLVVEDMHWIDPTTYEVLRRFVATVSDSPVLVVGTHRPQWAGSARLEKAIPVRHIALGPLAPSQVRDVVRATADRPLDDEALGHIVERSDGNPFYAQELAISLGIDAANESEIPMTLAGSLMAQLDRLGPAKEAAQAAAVIGRTFSADLLTRMLDRSEAPEMIDRLVESGLVTVGPPVTPRELAFRHALVRDAAYDSLLTADRRSLHGDLARLLRGDGAAVAEPEIVAYHHAQAEEWAPAIEMWRRAGERAVRVGAVAEAVKDFQEAVALVPRLPAGLDRDEQELDLLLDLAPASMTAQSYASAEPKDLYDRAVVLATRIGDEDRRFTALWGGSYVMEIQARWKESRANIDALLALDRASLRPDLPIQIDHQAATYAALTGQHRRALVYSRRIVDEYDIALHQDHRHRFAGHDPGVCGTGQFAVALLLSGCPDEALSSAARAKELAAELGHLQSIALASFHRSTLLMGIGDRAPARREVEDLIAICRRHGFSAFLRPALLYQAAALDDRSAAHTALSERIDSMRKGRRTGYFVPWFAGDCAEAAIDVGDHEHALATLDYAEWVAGVTGEDTHLGRIHLLRGRALRSVGPERSAEAADALRIGAQWASETANRWIGLQVAAALAEISIQTGSVEEARAALVVALEGIKGGAATPPVRSARAVLDRIT